MCDRWADRDPARIALINVDRSGRCEEISYGALREASNRLANALVAFGIKRGDRVAILLPQGSEVAAIHIAIYKAGAVALPLAALFGIDAISYRLRNSGTKALFTDAQGLAKLAEIRDRLPNLATVVSLDGATGRALDYRATVARAAPAFTPVATTADDPALMVYTSGTTGQPKGALHAHRVLIGHMPGIELHHDLFPQPGDRIWTPADWAWAGGLLNCMLPGLLYGAPVVARRFDGFDPEEAFAVMAAAGVRNAFIPPTALRMMRSVPEPRTDVRLRSLASGGETLGAETYEWGKATLGLVINEVYGQTECNLVIGACAALGISKPALSASRSRATPSGSSGRTVHCVRRGRPDRSP